MPMPPHTIMPRHSGNYLSGAALHCQAKCHSFAANSLLATASFMRRFVCWFFFFFFFSSSFFFFRLQHCLRIFFLVLFFPPVFIYSGAVIWCDFFVRSRHTDLRAAHVPTLLIAGGCARGMLEHARSWAAHLRAWSVHQASRRLQVCRDLVGGVVGSSLCGIQNK